MRPPSRSSLTGLLSLALVGILASGALAASGVWRPAGPHADGTGTTPVGWEVTPAGKQTKLGDLPVNAVASPDGRWLVVSNAGQATQSLQVVDTDTGTVTQTIEYRSPEAVFTGLAFNHDGSKLYASGGGNNKIRTYTVTAGTLVEGASIPLPTTSADGKKINPYPAGIALTPDDGHLLVADRLADAVTDIDLSTGQARTVGVGHAPFAVVISHDGEQAWVTEQGAKTVTELDISSGKLEPTRRITVGTHPNQALLNESGSRLFVANGDSDEVSVIDTGSGTVVRTISLAPYDGALVGSTPVALALSDDEQTLYVANAGNNDVAVVDLATSRVAGLIPTAWYPTSVVRVGGRLFVTNAKGLGAGPNNGPGQPNPEDPGPKDPAKYVGSMMVGTLSVIGGFDADQLKTWTEKVRENNGFDDEGKVTAPDSPVVPHTPGQGSPIKHVIYVVKENRTYDQVFGDLGKGHGDPSLNLFGNESASNSRALENQFVTFDNFYADAEISAQGWNWAVAANSNPYSEEGWPANYSGRNHPYPSENGNPAQAPNEDPANAYIWDRLANAGISFRNYGFYVENENNTFHADDPLLEKNTDHNFRGYDLACPDASRDLTAKRSDCGLPRIEEWEREFQGYVEHNNLPTMEFIRLPNDHTAGTRVGWGTPKAYVADNDLAVGKLVDAVSHSKYWKNTAIFVTEDDAQNGPDHIDAHRTTSWVISPYTRTGAVDSTFYSTASMLRTMELIVGLTPMTQFDAYSTPMSAAFTARPNFTPYDVITPTYPIGTVNGANAPLAAESEAQNLDVADAIDERSFNEAIWKSVRGADSVMPAPVHRLRWTSEPAEED